jgi:thiol-disulfide isomerase/thioredoxin
MKHALLAGLMLLLAACAPAAMPDGAVEKPAAAMTEESMTEESMTEEPMTEEPMAEAADAMHEPAVDAQDASMTESLAGDAMMEMPAWFGAALTDVHTGETFMVSDFSGKVVLVETLAMWCPNCKQQQEQVKALHDALGEMGADLVSIGLDIDPNERGEDLKAYVESNGFDWKYAVAPVEVARDLAALYGDQFLNPPSTPMLIIDRHGAVHPLPFGLKRADELKQALDPFLSEGM